MSSAEQTRQRRIHAYPSARLAAGVLALGMLPWLSCSLDGSESSAAAVQATRADLVTDTPPRPAHLAELVPDAPHVALPVPAAEDVGTVAGMAGVEGGAAIYTIDIPGRPGGAGCSLRSR